MTVHYFSESMLCVTYINSITNLEFYFVGTFPLTLGGRELLHYISIKSLERILRPIFAARYPLINSAKLLNIWYEIITIIQERLK